MALTIAQRALYQKWKTLVNMSYSDLDTYYQSAEGLESGLSAERAQALGIRRGRDSATAILRMLQTDVNNWTDEDWDWAKRQISFNSRMKGNPGPLFDNKNRPTRKLKSLLIWGHKPDEVSLDQVYQQNSGV